MARVTLDVRTYGQQGVEFVLRGHKATERRDRIMTWCFLPGLLLSLGGFSFCVSSSSLPWNLALVLVSGMATFVFSVSGNVIVEEAMLVVPALGVQVRKTCRNGTVQSKFVDLDVIAGVAVTEAITFSNVVYSLVLMVEGQRDMEVPFETFRPRIAVLQDIYLETRALLFPSGSDRTMRLPVDVSPRPWH